MGKWLERATAIAEYTRTIRRDFHQHPELGFQEFRTAKVIANQLSSFGLDVKTAFGKTGVVTEVHGDNPGSTILLRFDMDALPIQEESDIEYCSVVPGVMHACGHDGHMAIGLATARLLQSNRKELTGNVRFIFQPAEEGMGGAEQMIEAGALENPTPGAALALHLWNEKPNGWMGISPGPVMAGADILHIRVIGKGGHGALPHLARDPILAAAQLIVNLQSVISRCISPLDAGVISITEIRAGDAYNVIPPGVEMQGTMRSFSPLVRDLMMEKMHAIIEGAKLVSGCDIGFEVQFLTPAVVNSEGVTKVVHQSALKELHSLSVAENFQTMGSEDMAFILGKVPGCYFFVGSANDHKGLNFGHHHPKFDFDEDVLPAAVATMCSASENLLISKKINF